MGKESWSSVLVGVHEISENSAVLQRLEPHEKCHICGAVVAPELSTTQGRISNLKQRATGVSSTSSYSNGGFQSHGWRMQKLLAPTPCKFLS